MAHQPHDPQARQLEQLRIDEALGRIKHKILVMSGKGGVGKSTVAVNLAVALAKTGRRVGLMDVDLHGPTVPVLLGMTDRRPEVGGEGLQPLVYSENLKVMSMGNLLDEANRAVIWRGPLKIGAIRQFIGDVAWGELDVLVIDSPPGTGDEPLTVAQTITGAEALIVTTPQEVSLADVRKSISFCRAVDMPILGIVENMSGYACPHCGHVEPIFGVGGGRETALGFGIPFLGAVPIDPTIVRGGDAGAPYAGQPDEAPGQKAFAAVVAAVEQWMAAQSAAPEPPHHGCGGKCGQAEPEVNMPAAAPAGEEKIIVVPTYQGALTNHFGHAEAMTFFIVRDGKIVAEKLLTPPEHAPGVIPQWLAEQGAHVIIAGGMGSRAQDLFRQSGIEVVVGAPAVAARRVVESYLDGTLEAGENVCDH